MPMLVLVANLGSTPSSSSSSTWSKNGEEVARGGYERIGQKVRPTQRTVTSSTRS